MSYRGLLRRKLLEQIYYKMSDEEKRTFVQLSMQDKSHAEIMAALNKLKQKAEANHHSFVSDFAANILGNGVWDSAVWLLSKMIKKL